MNQTLDVVPGILIVLALSLLTPYFYFIPRATLSSVIICAVLFMVEVGMVSTMWKSNKRDLIPALVTFFACLGFGVELGILIGIAVDISFLLYFNARPRVLVETLVVRYVIVVCAESPGGSEYVLVTPSSGLLFPAVDFVREAVAAASLVRRTPPHQGPPRGRQLPPRAEGGLYGRPGDPRHSPRFRQERSPSAILPGVPTCRQDAVQRWKHPARFRRHGTGAYRGPQRKLGLIESGTCDCGEEGTPEHVVLECVLTLEVPGGASAEPCKLDSSKTECPEEHRGCPCDPKDSFPVVWIKVSGVSINSEGFPASYDPPPWKQERWIVVGGSPESRWRKAAALQPSGTIGGKEFPGRNGNIIKVGGAATPERAPPQVVDMGMPTSAGCLVDSGILSTVVGSVGEGIWGGGGLSRESRNGHKNTKLELEDSQGQVATSADTDQVDTRF
uniref:(California timema) hypothetical protein n=1 Tax=Timema californicum TaxID=61474 RepID=A0A7R9P7U1_TIMCA|nr:unnamed protein product [Timema californicum]